MFDEERVFQALGKTVQCRKRNKIVGMGIRWVYKWLSPKTNIQVNSEELRKYMWIVSLLRYHILQVNEFLFHIIQVHWKRKRLLFPKGEDWYTYRCVNSFYAIYTSHLHSFQLETKGLSFRTDSSGLRFVMSVKLRFVLVLGRRRHAWK